MNSKGITLLEILITMAIVSVISLLLANILINNSGMFYNQSAKIQTGISTNDVLTTVSEKIKVAESVATGYPELSPTYTSSADTLVLKIRAINQSGDLIDNTDDYFVYTVEQSFFREKVFPDPASSRRTSDRILSSNVNNVLFQYFDSNGVSTTPSSAKKVVLTLTLNQELGEDGGEEIATTEAYLVNN